MEDKISAIVYLSCQVYKMCGFGSLNNKKFVLFWISYSVGCFLIFFKGVLYEAYTKILNSKTCSIVNVISCSSPPSSLYIPILNKRQMCRTHNSVFCEGHEILIQCEGSLTRPILNWSPTQRTDREFGLLQHPFSDRGWTQLILAEGGWTLPSRCLLRASNTHIHCRPLAPN